MVDDGCRPLWLDMFKGNPAAAAACCCIALMEPSCWCHSDSPGTAPSAWAIHSRPASKKCGSCMGAPCPGSIDPSPLPPLAKDPRRIPALTSASRLGFSMRPVVGTPVGTGPARPALVGEAG